MTFIYIHRVCNTHTVHTHTKQICLRFLRLHHSSDSITVNNGPEASTYNHSGLDNQLIEHERNNIIFSETNRPHLDLF